MAHRPRCLVISGPSGGGKTAAAKRILKAYPRSARLVTFTCRAPRPEEKDGVDYHFISEAELRNKVEGGEVLEYTRTYGNYYGSPTEGLGALMSTNALVVVLLDIVGLRAYKCLVPDAFTVYLMSPQDELRARLERRSTATREEIELRLSQAAREDQESGHADLVVPSLDGQIDTVVVPTILAALERWIAGTAS
jgi:guanylate kinase